VPGLCGECHDNMAANDAGVAWATPHPPVEQGRCGTCHKPHGTTLPALLVGRAIELCIRCHADVHKDHREVGESERVVPPDDFPMTEEGRFFCSGCHLPHGSEQEFLWFEEMASFCPTCHRM
jgi:predicted CXXCH cytochrome family protein